MPALTSVLKKVIKELPEEFATKAESVTPMLLKKGVKAEELKFSEIAIPKTGKVTKQALVEAEAKRQDKFYVTADTKQYEGNTLIGGKVNPTYREKILKYRRLDDEISTEQSRYTSPHFEEDPNYLMHTRIYDETMDGTPTRVLHEIQSDLHQAGRQQGYSDPLEITEDVQTTVSKAVKGELDIRAVEKQYNLPEYTLDNFSGDESLEELKAGFAEYAPATTPTSPYEKTWLRKGIEREVSDAIDEGRQQLAIPISGNLEDLARAPGVQKWYETQVVNTAKKIAKQSGSTFEIKRVPGKIPAKIGGYSTDFEGLSFYVKTLDKRIAEQNLSVDSIVEELRTKYGVGKEKATVFADMVYDMELEAATGLLSDALGAENYVDYAMIKLNPKAKGFSLYSSPVAGAFVAYQAYQAGMTQEQVNEKLTKDYDYDVEDLAEVAKRVDIITQAQRAGMSIEEIRQKMTGREVTADTVQSEPTKEIDYDRLMRITPFGGRPTPKRNNFEVLTNSENQMTAEELVSSMKVLHPTMVSDTITSIPAYFGNKEAQQRYDQAREASRLRIVNLAKENYGLDLVWQPSGVGSEGWYAQTENGLVEVTPGFWEDIKKVTGEVIGGIGGAIAGGKLGATVTLPVLPIVGPLAEPFGTIAGAAVGGWLGSVAGSQADYMYQAIKLHEDMEVEAMAYRGLNALEAAAIGEIIGFPVAKGFGAGWRGIIKAKELITGGESKAAYEALKASTFLNDSQIDAIVAQLEKHAKLSGNRYEKGIQAVALTEPGMQDLVRAAGVTKPKVSAATAFTVSDRAEQVLAQTADLTDEQVPRLLAKDLQNYVMDVKDQYGMVKAQATQSPHGLNFGWDFDDLAVYPVLEDLMTKITDPSTKEKFLLQMERVSTMSESRNFGDLIELRQITNDFLYNKKIVKADDMATLRGVIANIDEAIEDGALYVLEDPAKWLDDWSQARIDYSKMKQIEKTAMYRTIFNKDGSMRAVQPKTVVKALGKHITSIDGSFEEVMTKLPIEGRKLYEGAVVDSLAQQYTAGVEKGAKAIHFPMLADELKKINFTTPDARTAKKALIELGETFKNDVYLAQTANQISIPKFQSYLTTDPVVRAKFEVASGIFNYIKSKAPGDANKQLALVRATSKLLEKPLDVKNFKTLQAELFDDANLSKQVLELQQLAARNRMKEVEIGTPKVKVYKGGKLKGTGTSKEIPMHRIATLKQASEIAETEALTLDSKSLDSVLKKYGYEAVLQGSDRVRILGGK